jgi:hypothetical protein
MNFEGPSRGWGDARMPDFSAPRTKCRLCGNFTRNIMVCDKCAARMYGNVPW